MAAEGAAVAAVEAAVEAVASPPVCACLCPPRLTAPPPIGTASDALLPVVVVVVEVVEVVEVAVVEEEASWSWGMWRVRTAL